MNDATAQSGANTGVLPSGLLMKGAGQLVFKNPYTEVDGVHVRVPYTPPRPGVSSSSSSSSVAVPSNLAGIGASPIPLGTIATPKIGKKTGDTMDDNDF